MAISAFPILDKATDASYTSGDILGSDLDFSKNTTTRSDLGTPANTMREIQVQFLTGSAGILSVTFDGTTFFNLNNGETILGLATITLFVDNTTFLNFEFSVGASIVLTVGG